MAQLPRVLAVAGSLRTDSLNRKLLAAAVEALRGGGVEVDALDLRDLALPLYDGDLEASSGLPPGAVELKQRLGQAQGLLIASPEYNSSIPGAFKNAIDWASRGAGDPFAGKLAALMAASPGRLGGNRMMPHLRQVLTTLGVWILPDQVTVAQAHEAFGPDGALTNPFFQKQVQALMAVFAQELRLRAGQGAQ